MKDKVMVDTNVWVYLYAKNPEDKYLKAKKLVSDRFDSIMVSAQILGELYKVLTQKKLTTQDEAKQIIVEISTNFPVWAIDTVTVLNALEINSNYGYSYWDSLVLSAALLNDCTILYSEDMQHEQLIAEKTRIINPF